MKDLCILHYFLVTNLIITSYCAFVLFIAFNILVLHKKQNWTNHGIQTVETSSVQFGFHKNQIHRLGLADFFFQWVSALFLSRFSQMGMPFIFTRLVRCDSPHRCLLSHWCSEWGTRCCMRVLLSTITLWYDPMPSHEPSWVTKGRPTRWDSAFLIHYKQLAL